MDYNHQWKELVDITSKAFNMPEEQKNRLGESKIAKLIGLTPYVADCRLPKRTALNHLSTYVLSTAEPSKSAFKHHPNDNRALNTRLKEISHFNGGNKKVIKRSMDLLTLNMLSGYNRDLKKDQEKGEYNPISDPKAKKFNETRINRLNKRLSAKSFAQTDAIMTPQDAQAGWWRL